MPDQIHQKTCCRVIQKILKCQLLSNPPSEMQEKILLFSSIVMLFPFPPSRSPLIVVCIILLNLHHRVKRSYSIIHSAGLFGCGIDSSPAAGTWGCLGLYPLYGIHTSALSNTCCRKGSSLSENIFRVMKDTC